MRLFIISMAAFACVYTTSAQVGIGTATPNPAAVLELSSTNKGLLPPRMTTGQRNTIVNPSPGLIIFNTTNKTLEIFTGSGWERITYNVLHWVKKLWGGANNDYPNHIQSTNDGGYIVAGYSNSSNSGTLTGISGNGGDDCWIIKFDASGNIQWQKLLGGSSGDVAKSIEQTVDEGYILAGNSTSTNTGTLTGVFSNGQSDAWIQKLDGDGNMQWQKLFGGGIFDGANSIKQTTDGGYIVCGSSNSSNTGTLTGVFNNGAGDAWIMKLDASGNIQWQKLLGGDRTDVANSIQQTDEGGYIVAGYSNSSNTGTLAGFINNGFNSPDCWVIKLDISGNTQWQKLIGGSSDDNANGVCKSLDGGYVVAAASASSNNGTLTGLTNNGGLDYWILKLDTIGNIQWQKLLGGSNFDVARSIQSTVDGGFIIAGDSQSSNSGTLTGITNTGGADYWILRLDGSGNTQWQKLLGGNSHDVPNSIKQIADGGFIVAGQSQSSNTGVLSGLFNNGFYDCWILKLDRYGNPF